ncbi:MAG: VTT domain-containing protein [Candidatus Paceibacterota bacterium]|jgi:membrane protein DedA with SNARE-associated domain
MEFLSALLALLEQSKYFLIAIGSFFEGSAMMMTAGLLWHLNVVTFWPAYSALLIGDILSDTIWYIVGRFFARSFLTQWGHFINVTPQIIEKIEKRFYHYHTKILTVSKLTMGFGFAIPILITAGMLRVPFARYITITVLGGIVWIFLLMNIGYYFGNVFYYIPKDFRIALAIVMPVLFFLVIRAASKKLTTVEW